MLGALQFAPRMRRRYPAWHQVGGRVVAACGLVVATSGLWMTQVYPWPAGDGTGVYAERLVFGAAMWVSIVLALDAVRRRDFRAHGKWMTRAYAIGLGAGTQVFTHLPWLLLADRTPGETACAVMMGAGWAINVVVAEWVIRGGRARPRAASYSRLHPGEGCLHALLLRTVTVPGHNGGARENDFERRSEQPDLGDDRARRIERARGDIALMKIGSHEHHACVPQMLR